jgi:translation initiation factor 1A
MPNNKGGKNYKKIAKKDLSNVKLDEPLATEEFHRYAQVEKKLGGSRILVNCSDNIKRQGIIRGKMYKKVWMNPGDILLVEINPELNQSHKSPECYIIHKYSEFAIQNLKTQGEIDFETKKYDTKESDIIFADESEEEDQEQDEIYEEMDKLNKEVSEKEQKKRILKDKARENEKQRQRDRTKKERGASGNQSSIIDKADKLNIDDI